MTIKIDKLFDLTGKVALVTGAASGLGKAIAEGYALYGAAVALVDIAEQQAKAAADAINKAGGNAIAIRCDISKTEDVKSTVAQVIRHFSKIDILVNNAGIVKLSKAEEMTNEIWDMTLDINLKGAFLFCREVGQAMIKRNKGGRIINMASIAGVIGLATGNATYAASKGGLIAMTRCLAIEWAKYNILVNAIAPSQTRTPMVDRLIEEKPEREKYFINNIPLGRLGEVSDIVGPAIFLASDASAFVTGHNLLVDGGYTAK
jgi:NAD(P)-dependent dehydrogenase (short-subunit alcohol dehydrogenase family)